MSGFWDLAVVEVEIVGLFAELSPNPYDEPRLWADAAKQYDATMYSKRVKSNPRKELYYYHRDIECSQSKARRERAMRERPDDMREKAAKRQREYAARRNTDSVKAARRREQNARNGRALRARIAAFLRGAQWIIEFARDAS